MNEQKTDSGFATWFSTYGSLTAARVLEHFDIRLPHETLVAALNNVGSVYFNVLRVPMKNIFNGIILQQAYDYNVYAQKLFIDYRLSPEYAKERDAPGARTRDELEEQYNQLLALGHAFNEHQLMHYRLISESQAWLIGCIGQLDNPIEDINTLNDDPQFNEKLNQFVERTQEIVIKLRGYRSQFYDMILRVTERLGCLSDYHFDFEHTDKERESLHFDDKIGGV